MWILICTINWQIVTDSSVSIHVCKTFTTCMCLFGEIFEVHFDWFQLLMELYRVDFVKTSSEDRHIHHNSHVWNIVQNVKTFNVNASMMGGSVYWPFSQEWPNQSGFKNPGTFLQCHTITFWNFNAIWQF